MIPGLLALLGCQLAGEFLVRAFGIPIPGPVVGMVLLLVALQVREPAEDSGLVRTMEGLLRHLQLLFVPAGTGVVQYLPLLGASLLPVVAGLLVGWLVTLAVTAAVVAVLLAVGPWLRRTGLVHGGR